MSVLYDYILDQFPEVFKTHFAADMLDNILTESLKIESIPERCKWLAKMIPQVSLSEIEKILIG